MVKKILILIIIILCSIYILDKIYYYGLSWNNNLKSSYIVKGNINSEILILGSCVPLEMINPEIIAEITGSTSFNLATNNSSFSENYANLYLYLKNNKNPKVVLLYVSTESVDGNFSEFNTYRFIHLNDSIINQIIENEDPEFNKHFNYPFIKYAYFNQFILFNSLQGVFHKIQNKNVPYFANGYIPPVDTNWDRRLDYLIKNYPIGKRYNWNLNEIFYLNKIIKLCQSRNIDLIMFEPPIYYKAIDYMNNRDSIKESIYRIADENEIKYLVFDTMKISYDTNYFFSILHTTPKGSEVFTKVLSKELNKLFHFDPHKN